MSFRHHNCEHEQQLLNDFFFHPLYYHLGEANSILGASGVILKFYYILR